MIANIAKYSSLPTVFTFSTEATLTERPQGNRLSVWGTAHLLLYLMILLDLQEKKLSLNQNVVFPKGIEKEKNALRSTKATAGETRPLLDVLNQAISLNAPDCIIALAEIYGGVDQTQKKINALGKKLNISRLSHINITGRKTAKQQTNLFDYFKIATAYLSLAKSSFALIRNRLHVIKGVAYYPQSTADLKGDTLASIFWGTNQNDCFLFKERDGELFCSVVINGFSGIHTFELGYEPFIATEYELTKVALTNPWVNIIADTYFGEFQTEVRKRKKRTDALQTYGYQHSFEKIAEKMPPAEFNIVTYEGVLIRPEEECFNKRKVFYLGGNTKETIKELKRRQIKLVNLGNNHAKDYGDKALIETLAVFEVNKIATIGAGKNLKEGIKPIILTYQEKEIAIFAGYWYRLGRDRDFDFYSSQRSGVASLDGLLLAEIKRFREHNPETFIVTLAHWGMDFKEVMAGQKKLAKRLISAGVNLIIGSGPHKLQEIEVIDGVYVFYSIGNGVFNSDGKELIEPGSLPYSFFLKWHLEKESLRIYPFWNYNLANFWQPYFVEAEELGPVGADLNHLDRNHLLGPSKLDSRGNLYYDVSLTVAPKEEREADGSVTKKWFQDNLLGEYLDNFLPKFEFDRISVSPKLLKAGDFNQLLFFSLSSRDLKEMFYRENWQPAHRNNELLALKLPNQIGLIVTDTPIEEYRGLVPQYIVKNSLLAASRLGDYLAESYEGKMITITGSAGKTSVRLLLESLLREEKILSNNGNSNVHVPLLELSLNLNQKPALSIFEVSLGGMNHFAYGNEAYRLRSDVAILTSFGAAHSSQGIDYNLYRKADIFLSVKNGGTGIINGDIEEKYLWKILRQAQRQNLKLKIYSLTDPQADCYLQGKQINRKSNLITISLNQKRLTFSLENPSDGQIQNVMAALLALEALDYPVEDYLGLLGESVTFPRILETHEIRNKELSFTLIDDTHNSSVLAMKNALSFFKDKAPFFKGTRLLVLGDIADLGHKTQEEHQQLIPELVKSGATKIFLFGEGFKKVASSLSKAEWFASKDEISDRVKNYISEDSLVFIKGSSGSKFYTVADELKASLHEK